MEETEKKTSPKSHPKCHNTCHKAKDTHFDESPESKKQKTSIKEDQLNIHPNVVSPGTVAHALENLSNNQSLDSSSRTSDEPLSYTGMEEDSIPPSLLDIPGIIRVIPPLPDSPPPISPPASPYALVKKLIQSFKSPQKRHLSLPKHLPKKI